MSVTNDYPETQPRFAFGENWARFLSVLDEDRIARAVSTLRDWLACESLEGRTFLDIGSGSGLFSLAARRLGANVVSIDFDPQSVACTEELRRRFFPEDVRWIVREGSVLDEKLMQTLGRFDIVYSWGVLHHTGAMWRAIDNAASAVRSGGMFFIAIYNDQGKASRRWLAVKKLYNALPAPLRFVVLGPAFGQIWGPTFVRDLLRGGPLRTWNGYRGTRGMSPWHDVVDWVGGYPFEVAIPEAIVHFCLDRGFQLRRLKTCAGGKGCNEFLFVR